MEYLEEEDNQKYQEHFAKYIEANVEGDGLEELYESVHEKFARIRLHEKRKRSNPTSPTSVRPSSPTTNARQPL